MPIPDEKKRGGVVRVRTKKLSDGTTLRIYVYRKKGKRGGRTYAEKVKKRGTHKA